MTNIYFRSQVVFSAREAKIFSKENTWTILHILQQAGSKGLTEKELHKKLEHELHISISPSKTYDLLSRLCDVEWLHKYYDNDKKVEANRYCIGIQRDEIDIDEDFDEIIVKLQGKYIQEILFPKFETLLEQSLDGLNNDNDNKVWLPKDGEKEYCKRCRISHEAEEFFSSILEIAISEYLESEQFKKFVIKNKFAEEGYKV